MDGFPGEGAARPSDGDDREVGAGSRGFRSGRSAGSLRAGALWEGPFSGYAAPMSENGLTAAQRKMRDADVAEQAIDVFSHYYRALEDGATGLIPEDTIEPLTRIDSIEDVEIGEDDAREALSRTVLIKLNGGLGTSMGMDRAKSLLPVRDGKSFLDLLVDQVMAARRLHRVALPLIFMDSFRTRRDTLAALAEHPGIEVDGLPLDFLQNREPKLRADDLTPVTWEADPDLEWCPPGHGDIYTALVASGVLDALLERGYTYAMTSNSDNLGASPSARIAGWFAASGAPYAPEMCRRTPADVKGGHLAVRKSDGRIILRDTAQTPADEMALLHRPVPSPLLPHQQPLVRPGGPARHARRAQGDPRPAADQEREDGRSGQLLLDAGHPGSRPPWGRRWRPSRARPPSRFPAPASCRSRPPTICCSCAPTSTRSTMPGCCEWCRSGPAQ